MVKNAPVAVYLDLRDLQSARVWRWLKALGLATTIEVRPFCLDIEDPWECEAPPFGLELLMLVEQARDHGPEAIACLLDAAFERISPDIESAHAELAVWLQIGHAAGLPLQEYDEEMERLKAEVGYWMAEARDDFGVLRTPTFLFEDGTTIYIQLDREIGDPADAHRFMEVIQARLGSLARDAN